VILSDENWCFAYLMDLFGNTDDASLFSMVAIVLHIRAVRHHSAEHLWSIFFANLSLNLWNPHVVLPWIK